MKLKQLGFELYRDDSNPKYGGPAYFAVLTNPGPDCPQNALAAAQAAVDAARGCGGFQHLRNGGSVQKAGVIEYDPESGAIENTRLTYY